MTLTIDLSKELEAALKAQAQALTHGVDAAGYARQVLERLKPVAGCSPNTGQHRRPRRSTPIAPTCSAAK
jgi:hypothetical protein